MSDGNNRSITISTGSILKVILLGILFYTLYLLRNFLLILLASIVIASFVDYMRRRLGKFGRHRVLAVITIYVVGLLILTTLFYLIAPKFVQELSNLIPLIVEFLPQSDFVNKIQNGVLLQEIQSLFQNVSLGDILGGARDFISSTSTGFFKVLSAVVGGVVNLVLIVILSLFLAIQERGIEHFLRIVTPRKYEEYMVDLWGRTERNFARWVQGQFLVSLTTGLLIFGGLTLLGVPYALLIAVLGAFFEMVPYGMIVAAIPAIVIAYISGGLTLALLVTVYYFVTQQFEAYILIPLIMKRMLGISPLVVILSILIGAQLAGFLGIILAIPVAVFLIELADDIYNKRIPT